MKRRVVKKKIRRRYEYGIKHLSEYCEIPKKVVIKEVGQDLWDVASDINEYYNDLIPYLDSISMELMWKYGTGWAGKTKG